ncbi:MAG: sulfatase, partial [Proteobacteria bacterium]|nr:sulfatase [Pseudomonadota bacterium]
VLCCVAELIRVMGAAKAPPNVVVVITCTTRKDELTPYGGHPEVTPFLNKMALEGALFEDAIATAPWTFAASVGLLTGKHAISLGAVEPSIQRSNRTLPDDAFTLAERLGEQGYGAFGATANPNLNPDFGFDQGFDWYQEGIVANLGSVEKKVSAKTLVDRTLSEVNAWKRKEPKSPFYLQLVFIEAHGPHRFDDPKRQMFIEPDEPPLVGQYRADLYHLDEAIGYLDEQLRQSGYDDDNTLLVVISDHGEGLRWPTHHGFSHGRELFPSQTHIGWFVRGPGVAAGHRIKGLASGLDLVPTVLSLAGFPTEDHYGEDWSAQVSGQATKTTRKHAFVDNWFRNVKRAVIFTDEFACQKDFGSEVDTTVRHETPFEDSCFNRTSDPTWLKPFSQPDILDELTSWREDRHEELDQHGLSPERGENEALNKRLEALGYLE